VKENLSGRSILLLLLFTIILGSFLIADSEKEKTPAEIFRHDWFQAMLDTEVKSLDDLIERYNSQQSMYIRISPPDPLFVWCQGQGMTPFDPKDFPADFLSKLVPGDSEGVTVYPVTLAEDPTTSEMKFYNNYGQVIAIVSPRVNYNKNWIALEIMPNLYASGFSQNRIDDLVQMYNPARLVVSFSLILKDDLVKYILKRSFEESIKEKDDGTGIMMAYTGAPVTNIVFTCVEKKTNGVMLTIAYPFDLSTYPTNCYTNRLEFFTCADLIDGYFDSKAITNVSSTTNWIEWVDTEGTTTNRFYAAGNADLDSDSDGLTDAREKYMYHSCPTNSDSDYDALSDYEECINRHTDPKNSDTNMPTACMTFPTNNFVYVWMP